MQIFIDRRFAFSAARFGNRHVSIIKNRADGLPRFCFARFRSGVRVNILILAVLTKGINNQFFFLTAICNARPPRDQFFL